MRSCIVGNRQDASAGESCYCEAASRSNKTEWRSSGGSEALGWRFSLELKAACKALQHQLRLSSFRKEQATRELRLKSSGAPRRVATRLSTRLEARRWDRRASAGPALEYTDR